MTTHEDVVKEIKRIQSINLDGFDCDWVFRSAARKIALIDIERIKPYTDKHNLIVQYLITNDSIIKNDACEAIAEAAEAATKASDTYAALAAAYTAETDDCDATAYTVAACHLPYGYHNTIITLSAIADEYIALLDAHCHKIDQYGEATEQALGLAGNIPTSVASTRDNNLPEEKETPSGADFAMTDSEAFEMWRASAVSHKPSKAFKAGRASRDAELEALRKETVAISIEELGNDRCTSTDALHKNIKQLKAQLLEQERLNKMAAKHNNELCAHVNDLCEVLSQCNLVMNCHAENIDEAHEWEIKVHEMLERVHVMLGDKG